MRVRPASTVTKGDGESIGGILRAARESRNVDISEAAAAMKLTPTLLGRIESDDTGSIPTVYLRGYIRSYANMLGIDSEPLLSLLSTPDLENIRETARERIIVSRARGWRKVKYMSMVAALVMVALSASYVYRQKIFQNEEMIAENVLLPAVADENAAAASAEDAPKDDAAYEKGEDTPAWKILSHYVPPADDASAEVAANTMELLLSGDCWIEVKDANGTPLLTKMGYAGERVQLSGELPLSILLGDATVAKLWFAGEPVDLEQHTRGAIARLYLP